MRGFTCHFVMGISQYPIIIPNFSNHGQIYSFRNPWEGLKVYVRRKRGLQRITEFSRYCICKLLPCTLSLIINLNSSPSFSLTSLPYSVRKCSHPSLINYHLFMSISMPSTSPSSLSSWKSLLVSCSYAISGPMFPHLLHLYSFKVHLGPSGAQLASLQYLVFGNFPQVQKVTCC